MEIPSYSFELTHVSRLTSQPICSVQKYPGNIYLASLGNHRNFESRGACKVTDWFLVNISRASPHILRSQKTIHSGGRESTRERLWLRLSIFRNWELSFPHFGDERRSSRHPVASCIVALMDLHIPMSHTGDSDSGRVIQTLADIAR